MADCNNQLQLVSEDSIFDLTPTDHDYVLRLLDVSSLSLASSSESERTPDCRASFKSEDQPAIGEILSTPPTWVIIAVKSLGIVLTFLNIGKAVICPEPALPVPRFGILDSARTCP